MSSPWLVWDDPQQEAGFQGIHYLELILLPTPQAPTEADLLIHLHAASPDFFVPASLSITGGRRIQSIDWTLTDADSADQIIALKLHTIGDPSEYTVTLLDGAGLPVHPFFASASFVFTIDCERGDCRPPIELAPRALKQRPSVDLLTKDYAGFVGMFAEWVKVKNPHWADLAPASLERVLVELVAHQADMTSYYQDRVANEAFVDLATQRYSLHQHAKLLGTKLFDGTAAETMLAFTSASDLYVAAEVEVTIAEGVGDANVVFYLTERSRVIAAHSLLALAAWPGADGATLPDAATEILLWGNVDDLVVGQKLAFSVETASTVPFSQVVSVTAVRFEELPGWVASPSDPPHANLSAVTVVTFDPPLARRIAPWSTEAPLSIYGNIGPARFGRSQNPRLCDFDLVEGNFATDWHDYTLERRPDFDRPLLRALRVPESPIVFTAETTPAGTVVSTPSIGMSIDGSDWVRVAHFDNSRSYDRHFVASADEDGSLWLEFGDGIRGRAVELLTDLEAQTTTAPLMRLAYRVGDPIAGNVGIGILTRFVPRQDALTGITDLTVKNVLPGTGGRQPETRDAARLRIPASLRHGPIERAVALRDYASAALGVLGVARATAKLLGGPFNAVLVLVDPVGQVGLTDALRAAVWERIDALRMAGREHFVSAPDYVTLEVKLAICVQPGSLPHRVRAAVLAALRPGTATQPGFFHPDRLSFGDDLPLGEVLALVQRVPGVRSVKALRFRKLKVQSSGPVETLIALAPTEVIRMDCDDNLPENGKLSVLVVGVDAGVTEADFVIEESP